MPGTDIATRSGALAVRSDQSEWTDDQLAILRHTQTAKATLADLRVFLHRCQQLELDPFAGQIHLVDYGGKPTIQVGIHGLESTARTTADRAGVDIEWEPVEWCGPDGQWVDVWLSADPPAAARVTLLRDGKRYPATVLYSEFVGMKKVYVNDRWTGEWAVNAMWTSKPAHMLGKCARAAALRMAFPRQLSNVYAPEELGERPQTVTGEVVTEATQVPPVDELIAQAAAAESRGDLEALWNAAAPTLSVKDQALLQKACAARATTLDAAAPAASDDAPAEEEAAAADDPQTAIEDLIGATS